jgi:ABC-2 type transport system ATP-binding protein
LIKNTIMELKKEGKTIIFSTHSMESAEKLCDEIFLINKGRKLLGGKLRAVKEAFGRQNIHIQYEGSGRFLEESLLIKQYDDFGKYTEVHLKSGIDPQVFLKESLQKVEIRKFEIVEPSLNEIFIRSISQAGNEENSNVE